MEEQAPQSPPKSSASKFILPIVAVIIILGAIFLFTANNRRNENADVAADPSENPQQEAETMTQESTQEENQASTASGSGYKDGTYQATGNYVSPGGAEELDVTVTLKDGVITDSQVVSKATRPNSVRFQGMFVSGFKPLVVGKSIDEVQLTKVSGSSLAPGGFNEALSEIKQQARS